MRVKADYVSFFYIIQFKDGRYYGGSRTSYPYANPSLLLKEEGYCTSSETINTLIKRCGLDSFRIVRVKEFKTADEALDYEKRFLTKINAQYNKKWINGNNGGLPRHRGRKRSDATKEKMSKAACRPWVEKYGIENTQERLNNLKRRLEKKKINPACYLSEEEKKRLYESRTGVKRNAEAREKMRKAKLKMQIVKCPHCKKEGKQNGMKRWHFNNCSEK